MKILDSLRSVVADTRVLTWRNLLYYRRMPQLIVFSTIQPIMFLLFFTYVFGGAIAGHSDKYIIYVLPGIFTQSVLFGSLQTGVGLAGDISKGFFERLRSLPMARSALLAGRVLSDTIRNIWIALLMTGVGMILGFRFENGFWNAIIALALVVILGFAFSWVSAAIGLLVRNPEVAQVAGFLWVFPLVFVSSAFVPVDTMPGALKAFAQVSPITVTIDSVRAFASGTQLGNSLLYYTVWIYWILLIFIPLSVYRFNRMET